MKSTMLSVLALVTIIALRACVHHLIEPAPRMPQGRGDATEPLPIAATQAPVVERTASIERSVPAGRTMTAIRFFRADDAQNTEVQAASVLLRSEESTECMYAVRVDQTWVTHLRDSIEGEGSLQQCMNARAIDGRWVFFYDEIGGYETIEGGQVDTSWFEAWSVVDGEFARVYPTRAFVFRKLPAGEMLTEAQTYHFNGERVGLEWAADGRTLMDVLEAPPAPAAPRRRVSKRER